MSVDKRDENAFEFAPASLVMNPYDVRKLREWSGKKVSKPFPYARASNLRLSAQAHGVLYGFDDDSLWTAVESVTS